MVLLSVSPWPSLMSPCSSTTAASLSVFVKSDTRAVEEIIGEPSAVAAVDDSVTVSLVVVDAIVVDTILELD